MANGGSLSVANARFDRIHGVFVGSVSAGWRHSRGPLQLSEVMLRALRGIRICVLISHLALTNLGAQQPLPFSDARASIAQLALWRLDPSPMFLRDTSSSADADFHIVFGGAIRSDGQIVIGNANPPELRFFDVNGLLAGKIGRRGNGPGEFQNPQRLQLLAKDTIAVFELFRVSLFDAAGKFLETSAITNQGPSQLIRPMHRLADGSLVGLTQSVGGGEASGEGITRGVGSVVLLRTDGRAVQRQLTTYRGGELVRARVGAGIVNMVHPLAFTTLVVGADASVYLSDTAVPEVRQVDVATGKERPIRIDVKPRRIESAVIREIRDRLRASGAQTRQQRTANEALVRKLTFEDHYPFFDRLLRSSAGWLFLRLFVAPPDTSASWVVLDPNGTATAVLRTPSALRVLSIGTDALLAVIRDGDDIERVAVYRIVKSTVRRPRG